MSTEPLTGQESIAHDDRVHRALTDLLAVERRGPGLYLVHSGSGETYAVDLRENRCTCPDHGHRGGWCKHLLRAAFETGRGIPGQCHECAALSGELGCADCCIDGFASMGGD